MNATVDRIENAYADVVAVEEVARGLMRVVSWSDEYYVDAAGGGCDCPDKTHNLPEGVACKHEVAAVVATTDTPGPWDADESLSAGGESQVMTDGGEVIAEKIPDEEIDEFIVYTHENGAIQVEDSKREAEERAEYVEEEFGDLTPEVFGPGEHPHLSGDEPDTAADKLDTETPEVVDAAPEMDHDPNVSVHDATDPEPADGQALADAADDLPERHVDEDPLKWLPHEFVDTIDGSPAINRKGFEVLGHFYDVDVTTDLEVAPEETDHEYARVKAHATIDGREVEAYGSAHVDRGDDKVLLLEMADTRAKKRALSLATGAGAVAVEELQNEPEGDR